MFQMGCVPGDGECIDDEKPRHAVTITKSFDLMTTEVTLGMFRAYAAATGVGVPRQTDDRNASLRQPIVAVSWEEAGQACRWLGGRLPTEAEWERAARGGVDGAKYVWGDGSQPVGNIADEALQRRSNPIQTIWKGYDDGFAFTAAPVGSFAANAYGLFDMAGNAWEWVADWYGPHPAGGAIDPHGPDSGQRRLARGASWNDGPFLLRVSFRAHVPADARGTGFGFRCARDIFP